MVFNHLECLSRLMNLILVMRTLSLLAFTFIGDFNISVEKCQIGDFCKFNCLEILIQKRPCYKNFCQLFCINLFLTNWPSYFQHNEVFENNFSDFHLLTVTEFKMNFQKQKIKIIAYHNYKKFDNNAFHHFIEKSKFNTVDLKTFKETVFGIFNKHAPMKR